MRSGSCSGRDGWQCRAGSRGSTSSRRGRRRRWCRGDGIRRCAPRSRSRAAPDRRRRCALVLRPPCPSRRAPPDRKSTRLNSSHLVISYAVFCLKKKKKQSTIFSFKKKKKKKKVKNIIIH